MSEPMRHTRLLPLLALLLALALVPAAARHTAAQGTTGTGSGAMGAAGAAAAGAAAAAEAEEDDTAAQGTGAARRQRPAETEPPGSLALPEGAVLEGGGPGPEQEIPDELLERTEGFYDVGELRRILQVARESGMTEEQVRQITIEDPDGNVINAWAYLRALEARREAEAKRRRELLNRDYLTVQDMLDELNADQREEVDRLRDELLFVE